MYPLCVCACVGARGRVYINEFIIGPNVIEIVLVFGTSFISNLYKHINIICTVLNSISWLMASRWSVLIKLISHVHDSLPHNMDTSQPAWGQQPTQQQRHKWLGWLLWRSALKTPWKQQASSRLLDPVQGDKTRPVFHRCVSGSLQGLASFSQHCGQDKKSLSWTGEWILPLPTWGADFKLLCATDTRMAERLRRWT